MQTLERVMHQHAPCLAARNKWHEVRAAQRPAPVPSSTQQAPVVSSTLRPSHLSLAHLGAHTHGQAKVSNLAHALPVPAGACGAAGRREAQASQAQQAMHRRQCVGPAVAQALKGRWQKWP